jgi:protein phosphatase
MPTTFGSFSPESAETAAYRPFEELVARFYEQEPRLAVRAEFGAVSHPGNRRDVNEDQYLVVRRSRRRDVLLSSIAPELLNDPEQAAYVMVVADGMGGHSFGDMASFLALRSGWDLGANEIKWPMKINDRESTEIKEKALVFVRLLHAIIQNAAADQARSHRMGTTLTIAYATGSELFVLNVGDSRAYLMHEGALRRLTRDHTLAQTLIDAGTILPDSPEDLARRHVLTNCLGGPSPNVFVDVRRYALADGDVVLLCSDGLSNDLTDDEIASVLRQHKAPQEACQALVRQALDQVGADNVTAVAGRFLFPGS